MESLDFENLKRNPEAIKSKIVIKEDRTISKEVLSILIPKFYFTKGLAKKNSDGIELLCVFPILDEKGNYAIVAESARQIIHYGRYEEVTVDDDVYEKYTYYAGDIMIGTLKIVKTDEVLFPLFDAFFMQGKIPKFLSYTDVSNMFQKADIYAGSRIADFPVIMDILVSALSRSKDDPDLPFKDTIRTEKDLHKPIKYIGLTDIQHAITNSGSRMIGGYFDKNMNIMVVNKEDKIVKDIETLRK